MGPGRSSVDFLARTHVAGALFDNGLPNGTEVTQEMDQLFSEFKRMLYSNRDLLLAARRSRSQDGYTTGPLSPCDAAACVFGGVIDLEDGSTLTLVNAYEMAFTPEKIKSAWSKCGYVPATRNGLKSDAVRFEVEDCIDVEIGEDMDPQAVLLEYLEKDNHEVVAKLEEKGYKLAKEGKRFIKRLSVEQIQGREAVRTAPNTRERQDALAKAHRAGQYFHIMNGGGVLNCADLLIGLERKEMAKKADEMRKEKEAILKSSLVLEEAQAVLLKPESSWLRPDFILAIKSKIAEHSNDVPKGGWSKILVKDMKELWITRFKALPGIVVNQWDDEKETELRRLSSGQINSVQETAVYGRSLEKNEQSVIYRFKAMGPESQQRILQECKAYLRSSRMVDPEEEEASISTTSSQNDEEVSVSTTSSQNDEEAAINEPLSPVSTGKGDESSTTSSSAEEVQDADKVHVVPQPRRSHRHLV
jgi:hypothetical protein